MTTTSREQRRAAVFSGHAAASRLADGSNGIVGSVEVVRPGAMVAVLHQDGTWHIDTAGGEIRTLMVDGLPCRQTVTLNTGEEVAAEPRPRPNITVEADISAGAMQDHATTALGRNPGVTGGAYSSVTVGWAESRVLMAHLAARSIESWEA